MQYVAHFNYEEYKTIPDWVKMVDADQVGMYKGRVVAYDFALDLEERYKWEQESLLKSDYFQTSWKNVKPFLFPAEAFSVTKDLPSPNVIFDNVVLEKRFQDHL
jgi:hypothetical protein